MSAIISRMRDYLGLHPSLRKWAWFLVIYVVSVIVFVIVAFVLQALVPK